MDNLPNRLSQTAAILARHAHLIALALFAAVGLAVFDDYGITPDEEAQHRIGYAAFNYIAGNADELTGYIFGHDIYYGVAVEAPLVAVECLLGLEDSRAVFLSRHLLTHLLFLAAGFFAWLLAYRMFGNRLVALLAMMIFLLHPRIYAHSFFNSKDPTFLSAFMVALYLTHRAFRRDSVWAFALCGAGVALLINIRIIGVVLVPAILGMLALDAFHAARRGERGAKRALVNAAAFSLSAALTLYAAFPVLWRDQLALIDGIRELSSYYLHHYTLFRGERVRWPDIPWDFIPTWILITTPPVALALGALGVFAVARLCAADWRGMFANSPARFGLLAVACLVLPVAVAVALNSNLYNDWRHMYFLWAPMCVLAAFGLRLIASLPRRLRAGAFALAALGIAAAAVQMVQLHPLQNLYFNPLAGKKDLADRWELDYFGVSNREALKALLEIQPSGRVLVVYNYYTAYGKSVLPPDDRNRIVVHRAASYLVEKGDGGERAIWQREVYGVPIASIVDVRVESERAFQAALAAASRGRLAASAGGFDMYEDSGTLAYIKEGCAESDASERFFLNVFPENPADLPQERRAAGFGHQSLNFNIYKHGGLRDGVCAIIRELPEYPISRIVTGQWIHEEGELWRAEIVLPGFYERRLRRAESAGEPALRAGFDVYVADGSLIYAKEGCGDSDARGRFWLSVFPENPADLPQERRAAGFGHESLNFDFAEHGAALGGECVAVRELPEYPISRIETGQVIPGEGELWRGTIEVGGR